MDKEKQRSLANSFREMHHESKLLVLPNAWDVASARIFEEAGVSAIATSSAGVAFSLGYPDGQRISRDEMLSAVARITAVVKVPVTADVESGYGITSSDAGHRCRGHPSGGDRDELGGWDGRSRTSAD